MLQTEGKSTGTSVISIYIHNHFFLLSSKFLAPSEAAYCSAVLCGPYFNGL